jgi:hypothetical protein
VTRELAGKEGTLEEQVRDEGSPGEQGEEGGVSVRTSKRRGNWGCKGDSGRTGRGNWRWRTGLRELA